MILLLLLKLDDKGILMLSVPAGSEGLKLCHLDISTPHFYDLTEMVLDDLLSIGEVHR